MYCSRLLSIDKYYLLMGNKTLHFNSLRNMKSTQWTLSTIKHRVEIPSEDLLKTSPGKSSRSDCPRGTDISSTSVFGGGFPFSLRHTVVVHPPTRGHRPVQTFYVSPFLIGPVSSTEMIGKSVPFFKVP